MQIVPSSLYLLPDYSSAVLKSYSLEKATISSYYEPECAFHSCSRAVSDFKQPVWIVYVN